MTKNKILFSALFATVFLFDISKARADDDINCLTGQQSCGTNCCWSIEGDTLKVTGGADGTIGTMDAGAKTIDGKYTYIMPWKDLKSKFSKVDIQGVENIGHAAFRTFDNITEITLGDTITSISSYVFTGNQAEKIILPDSLKRLGGHAFSSDSQKANNLKQIIIPDTITQISGTAFNGNEAQLANLAIICRGDKSKCTNVLSGYRYYNFAQGIDVPFSLAENVTSAKHEACNSAYYFWNGSECVREPDLTKRKCCDNCRTNDKGCWRVRYTINEATAVSGETNRVSLRYK